MRELENLVRRIAALHSEEVISADIVRLELQDTPSTPMTGGQVSGSSLSDSLHQHLATYFANHGDSLPPNGLYERVLREVEIPLLELTLAATRGNQIKAAELLGLNRNTLRKKIRELGVDVVRARRDEA